MRNPKPEPVLVLIEYDLEAEPSQEGYLRILNIAEVETEPLCELEGEGDWKIYTHLRAEGKRGGYAQLALKLKLPAPAEEYQITISPTKYGGGQELLQHTAADGNGQKCVYFIIPTRFGKKKSVNKITGKTERNILPGVSGSVTSAGSQYLRIHVPGEPEEVRRLRVCPSSFSEEQYREILQDIALIHRQLLMGQGRAKAVAVGQRREDTWEITIADIEDQVARIRAILRRLEAAPERELIAVPSRQPSYKLKKLTPKALMDQAAGKRLLRADIHEESFDIYEHRMIRTYLENLKKLVAQYRELEKRERKLSMGEPVSKNAAELAQAKLDEMDRSYTQLPLRVQGDLQLHQLADGTLSVPCFSDGSQPVLFCDAAHLGYANCLLSHLSIKEPQTAFFQKCIEKLKEQWEQKRVPFQVLFTGYFSGTYRNRLTRCAMEIKDLVRMEIPGECSLSADELPDRNDERFYYTALIRREAIQRKKQEDIRRSDDRWSRVEQEIGRLLTCSPLLHSAGTGERLHTSNLFAKHRNYRLAYSLMLEKQTQFAGIDLWEESSLPVDETNKIYELWCLFKMLSVWINDYSFALIYPSIDELTGQLLRHLRDENQTVETIVLKRTLKREGRVPKDMELRLDYDKVCKNSKLRPDYFLTITLDKKEGKEDKFQFCMDAKYRNYAPEQMTKSYWYRDMFEVALDKYIFRLGRDRGRRVNGSYIFHSDTENRGCRGQDTRRYFWSHIVAKREPKDPEVDQREWDEVQHYVDNKSRAEAGQNGLAYFQQELEEVEDCQFGSICFMPGNRNTPDNAFHHLMRMIIEHFLGLYQEKCWMCGSEKLSVKPRYTAANNKKYHIICEHCGEFWVETHCYSCGTARKLGKHPDNYYRVKNGRVWNVVCPRCGDRF